MSDIIKAFTFDRNAVLRTPELSATQAIAIIDEVLSGRPLDKTASNKVGALASYMGLFSKESGVYKTTPLADNFRTLYNQDKGDAWRWLLTRSLWLYVVPNGTQSPMNAVANTAGVQFSFFRLIMQILKHLQANPNEERYLYYDEFISVMTDDSKWAASALELTDWILAIRPSLPAPNAKPSLLGDLEVTYGLPRDNYNGLFNKLFAQTGLFEYIENSGKQVGIALRDNLDDVLQRRVRFIIDNPPEWSGSLWSDYLANQAPDLPLEVTGVRDEPPTIVPTEDVSNLVADATEALNDAGLRISEELVRRYIAALATKPFVVLSGLTGSGKTKLAQLVAQWLDSPEVEGGDAFPVGTEVQADRVTYIVSESNNTEISLRNDEGKITPFPRRLINEWANYIADNSIGRETPSVDIKEGVKHISEYVPFVHGSASHLKALAFHLLDQTISERKHRRYEVIPVEANWASTDDIFGYADALDSERYSRRPALDLVLRARANYDTSAAPLPYFLILDEMNLSHVERYFATILSALESGEAITLHGDAHDRDGVPAKLLLPPNLFLVGTINVDETTYQFSPKVLDRANVIEFRVSDEQMLGFLEEPSGIDPSVLAGKGAGYAAAFAAISKLPVEADERDAALLKDELMLFYEVLAAQGAEFGFRTAKEVVRFTQMHKMLSGEEPNFEASLDAQILQKLLPKLHGSQRKLEPLLRSLAILCHAQRDWQTDPKPGDAEELRTKVVTDMLAATDTRKKEFDPLTAKDGSELRFKKDTAYLPLSFEKLVRMLDRVSRDGFTSFAEA